MPNRLHDELAAVFSRHGHPAYEEPSWGAAISLLVLILEQQRKMMSNIDDLVQKAASEATALVDLNSAVAAAVAALPSGGGGPVGATNLSPDDQSKLDTAVSTIDSNIAKIGEIKALLSTPVPPTTTPPADAPPVTLAPTTSGVVPGPVNPSVGS